MPEYDKFYSTQELLPILEEINQAEKSYLESPTTGDIIILAAAYSKLFSWMLTPHNNGCHINDYTIPAYVAAIDATFKFVEDITLSAIEDDKERYIARRLADNLSEGIGRGFTGYVVKGKVMKGKGDE